MRLDDLDPSSNVRDLGSGGGGGGGGGIPILGMLLPFLFRGKMGCGTIGLIAVVGVVYLMMGGLGGLGGLTGGGSSPTGQHASTEQSGAAVCNTAERLFSCRVLASTEQVWTKIFADSGQTYRAPTLNFYTEGAKSGCGYASSAAGPYYCPPDQGLFLDTTFFDELSNRFGAKGDAAQAYVIAHEVGHHIQNLTGAAQQVTAIQQRGSKEEGNAASVKLELQADCYAGVWAKQSGRLEPGDIEEGMTAANAIGDDTLQRQSGGSVVPDSFTHGSSADRMRWLKRGLDTGDAAQCDTFGGGAR